ncbi:MAG TPA: aminotransferase class I/II-fold pyridoxal phosphate-dependent enzyme [Pedobacter sp.]|nr:aminotransferase class I/II-fold pyridoxal phosphate-dependent enzyme [Pedobacter sp.]
MDTFNRRNFLKKSSIGLLPVIAPLGPTMIMNNNQFMEPSVKAIKFFGDGEMFEPGDYLNELQKAHTAAAIVKDRYGVGGVIETLEKKFCEITGKEKAIFMPSGTMANQFAIAVLSDEKTKVFVQDTSHVYRDEADAAQALFNKRLMPLAKDETYFTADQLKKAIANLKNEEVFESGIGAVSIENPVRRADGKVVPIDEIKKISEYCRNNNIKLHLDGARLYMASAWTGVSIKEYTSYFDTVYISLYKYLGASGGAMLCGPKEIIDKMTHLIKIHGGSMYGNWTNAAMALHRLEGFETRLKNAISSAKEIFTALNQLQGIKIESFTGGTNTYRFKLAKNIDGRKMQAKLNQEYNIRFPMPNSENEGMLMVNETLLYQSTGEIINAFKKSIQN